MLGHPGQPLDNQNSVKGDRISKEYRDRYANFSKSAHFEFGKQDDNKHSATTNQFYPRQVNVVNKKEMAQNIENMRGSHFSVGKYQLVVVCAF